LRASEWAASKKSGRTNWSIRNDGKGISNQIKIRPRVRPNVIAKQIEDACRRSAEPQANQIRVELQDGKVILRGTVRLLAESDNAERIAWFSPGVTQIENHLVVGP
jgi:osmotically-inducible protein OsmY